MCTFHICLQIHVLKYKRHFDFIFMDFGKLGRLNVSGVPIIHSAYAKSIRNYLFSTTVGYLSFYFSIFLLNRRNGRFRTLGLFHNCSSSVTRWCIDHLSAFQKLHTLYCRYKNNFFPFNIFKTCDFFFQSKINIIEINCTFVSLTSILKKSDFHF